MVSERDGSHMFMFVHILGTPCSLVHGVASSSSVACSHLELTGRDGEMETGWRQLAVTSVSRKQAVLCADVQLALGKLVVLLAPTTYP